MSRTLALALLLGLAALPPAAQEAAPEDIARLREIKLELWPRAYREQDVALLERLLDERFQMIDAAGAVTGKADELAWVRAHRPGYDSFRYEIERLDVFDGKSAVVSGLGTITGTRDGKPYRDRYRSSNVLVKQNGEWRAVASHVSSLEAVSQ